MTVRSAFASAHAHVRCAQHLADFKPDVYRLIQVTPHPVSCGRHDPRATQLQDMHCLAALPKAGQMMTGQAAAEADWATSKSRSRTCQAILNSSKHKVRA